MDRPTISDSFYAPGPLRNTPGVVAVFEDARAVDEDVADTGGELVGVIERRVVDNRVHSVSLWAGW